MAKGTVSVRSVFRGRFIRGHQLTSLQKMMTEREKQATVFVGGISWKVIFPLLPPLESLLFGGFLASKQLSTSDTVDGCGGGE